jgi:pimeloyl-ACP methyl ester carboxylesterase
LILALGYQDWVVDLAGESVDVGVRIRREAVLALGEFQDPLAMEAVSAVALADEDERVLEAAGSTLASFLQRLDDDQRSPEEREAADPAAEGFVDRVDLARAMLLTGSDALIEANETLLVNVLSASPDGELSEVMVKEALRALADPRPQIVRRARRMIALRAHQHLDLVIGALHEPDRAAPAAHALGELRDNRALDALVGGLGSSDPAVRRECVWALGELADSRAVADLFGATSDHDYEVRKAALSALDELGAVGVIGGLATSLYTMTTVLMGGRESARQLPGGGADQLELIQSAQGISPLGAGQADPGPDREPLVPELQFATATEVVPAPPAGRPIAIAAADGTKLHAELFGPEDAPTIIFAHGWGAAWRFWTNQIHDLSQDFRVVAYDLRGHGESEPARSGDYSFDAFGDDLEAVLGASVKDGARAIVVGHSLGATSVAAWAQRYDVPSRVSAAALLHLGVGDVVSERLLLRIAPLEREDESDPDALPASSRVHDAVIRYVAFGDATSAQVEFYKAMLFECQPEVRADCLKAMADPKLAEALRCLTVPTLVVGGELDKLAAPAEVAAFAERLPSLAAIVELPETGHMGPLEQPEQINLHLRELAAGVTHDAAA